MKNTLEQQLKNGREISMTSSEKNMVLHNVKAFMENHPIPEGLKSSLTKNPVRSPYMNAFSLMPLLRIGTSALTVALVLGGSLTYASGKALPGSILYPVKVHVREVALRSLVRAPEAKIAFDQERIKTRIKELESLKEAKNEDSESIIEAEIALTSSVESFEKSLEEGEISGRIAIVRDAEQNVLETLGTYSKSAPAIMSARLGINENETQTSKLTNSDEFEKKNARIEKIFNKAHENMIKRSILKEKSRLIKSKIETNIKETKSVDIPKTTTEKNTISTISPIDTTSLNSEPRELKKETTQ